MKDHGQLGLFAPREPKYPVCIMCGISDAREKMHSTTLLKSGPVHSGICWGILYSESKEAIRREEEKMHRTSPQGAQPWPGSPARP